MEYPVVKTNFNELDEMDFERINPAAYDIQWDGQRFEVLVNYKKDRERAVVFGGGFVARATYKLPLFSRHSWANEIDATCICYFDSTLRLTEKAGLLWCYGNNDDWYLERVATILLKILDNLGIRIADTLFYGSSGGGFTAAALAALLGGRATVINPQLIATNYLESVVQEFKRACLRDGEELIPERVDLVKLFQREGYQPKVHLIQNTDADRDLQTQLNPFLKELEVTKIHTDFLTISHYRLAGGHTTMPPKEDCIQTIREDLNTPFTPPKGGTPFLRRVRESAPHMTLDMFRQRLNDGFYHRPQMYFSDHDVCGVADEIINGHMKVYGNLPAMPFMLKNLDWNAQFSPHPRTFQLYLQSLTAVGTLTRAYELSFSENYLSFAESLIHNWYDYASCGTQGKANPYLWVDHSAASRTEYLIYFGRAIQKAGYGAKTLFQLLQNLLEWHGTWLYEDQNYAFQHNHGVIHDKALLYVGTLFQKRGWVTLAKRRIQKQEAWAFAEDYVHKENSVTYAIMLPRMFETIGTFLQRYGDPFGDKLTADMNLMREYGDWATKPNGIIAQIGDTQNFPGKRRGTAEQIRRKTPEIHRMYPVSGIYFYRSNYDSDVVNDTWKTFKSGYVRTTHKHADDGSFILYAKGYEIFVDCGIYGITVNDFRRYFLSALAHNCVVVDGKSWVINEENMAKVGVTGYYFFPRYDHIRAFNDAWPGVHMERDFCSADDLTVIRDTIRSQETHQYTQLFHLGEDMRILEAGDREVRIQIADSGYTVFLRQHGDPTALTVHHGDLKKPGYGLISRATNHLDVITTLAFDMTAKDGNFITSIVIEDKNGNVRLFDHTAPSSSLRYNEKERRFDLENLQIRCDFQKPENQEEDMFAPAIDQIEQKINGNSLLITVHLKPEYEGKFEFAWYLYSVRQNETIVKDYYGKENVHSFSNLKPGEYRVKYFMKNGETRKSFLTDSVIIKEEGA